MLRDASSASNSALSRSLLADVFLPAGFPASVSSDYLEYQLWDTVQAFCSSIVGQLATRAVLKGVGVGDASATPLVAALTWTLRDGAGMLGRIVFAWAGSSSLDNDPRFWRLMADVLNDLALFLDIIVSPMFGPQTVLPVLCLSSVLRAIVGVAGGASRMALTQHQARRNNTADVSAKDGSQETAVNLLALVTGLLLLPLVREEDRVTLWAVYVAFTLGHIVANYKAVKAVVMDTFNEQRVDIVTQELATSGGKTILTPAQVAARERLYYVRKPIRLGVRVTSDLIAQPGLDKAIGQAKSHSAKYIILTRQQQQQGPASVKVVVAKEVAQNDWVAAAFEAHLALLSAPIKVDDRLLSSLRDAGWNVDSCSFHAGEWRGEW